jgi:hypothetical protein
MSVAAVALVFLLSFFFGTGPAAATPTRTPSLLDKITCDCSHFEASLAEARAVYASRNDDIEMPLTPVMHDRYRAQVDIAYARATCLAACENVPELARNQARILLAESGFKDASLGAGEWRARLTVVLTVTSRCLEIAPDEPRCLMWYAASRGVLARGSWNPLNLRLPLQITDEFHRARGNLPPGYDKDGSATRGEAAMLLKAPRYAGGDPVAGRKLIEEATTAPGFGCLLANRLVVAEALGRTGDMPAARRELQAVVGGGLPACSPERYENARALEEAARCLARLDVAPDTDPGWDEDCRRAGRE